MRARRQFRPTVDFMPSRFALSGAGAALDPMDSTTVPTGTGTTQVDPMDPTSTPTATPTDTPPTIADPGSFMPTPTTTSLC